MKLSSLTKRERALAERIAGGPLEKLDDQAVLAVGFVHTRRREPTVSLHDYLATHDADGVRDQLDIEADTKAPAKKTAAKKATDQK